MWRELTIILLKMGFTDEDIVRLFTLEKPKETLDEWEERIHEENKEEIQQRHLRNLNDACDQEVKNLISDLEYECLDFDDLAELGDKIIDIRESQKAMNEKESYKC